MFKVVAGKLGFLFGGRRVRVYKVRSLYRVVSLLKILEGISDR